MQKSDEIQSLALSIAQMFDTQKELENKIEDQKAIMQKNDHNIQQLKQYCVSTIDA
jgi:hypothetical protein